MSDPVVRGFWDKPTGSWQYVFHCPETMKGAIVDPVLDFDPLSGGTGTQNAEALLAYVEETGIELVWILDTHPHADHFSAAHWLSEQTAAPKAIGAEVVKIQRLWKDIYNFDADFPTDGRQWDRLFEDGARFDVGNVPMEVMLSTGHTMASITYVAGNAVFVHDTLMMPDSGSTRADFPGGDSGELYDTIRRILSLPGDTRLYIGHDYPDGDADPACMATVAEHLATNIHFKDDPDRETFRRIRDERDATLSLPQRMLAALQINTNGGRLPAPEANGRAYLKIPLDYFTPR